MRYLRTYPTLDPIDWTATNTQTTARNRIVLDDSGHAWAVMTNGNRWTFHNAAGTEAISGLDLWAAVQFLNHRQCRVVA